MKIWRRKPSELVNNLTLRNWLVGCYIAEYEFNGVDRAAYGEKIFSELVAQLSDISNCNPPIGILLCTDKNYALAEYALAGMDNSLFVSKYVLELPKEAEMQAFIERQAKVIGDSE